VKERPIPFNGPMVRAVLAGTKTQTRRLVKPQPFADPNGNGWQWHGGPRLVRAGFGAPYLHTSLASMVAGMLKAAPYAPGDRLYVREAWAVWFDCYVKDRDEPTFYREEFERWPEDALRPARCRPSIHMPRWRSRINLDVVSVRVERLQEISETDAWAEGCIRGDADDVGGFFPAEEPIPARGGGSLGVRGWDCALDWYADLWESINGAGSWDANPWVWVVEFRRGD
jgi:hypothetical protein